MSRWTNQLRRWGAWALLASGLCGATGLAARPVADLGAYLKQTETLEVTDHPRFLQQLAELNQAAARLTPGEQWRLRRMNAWEAMYEGDYAKSEALFRDIIQHSGDPTLVDSASALLLSQLELTRHYEDAFELANRLAARLPQVTDPRVRRTLLLNLSQSLGLTGQTDLAVRYARMALDNVPPGGNRCYPLATLAEALNNGHRLKSDSPELQQAIDACPAASEPVYNQGLGLTRTDLYLHEGQPRRALALLDRIEPGIAVHGYAPDKLSAQVYRAQALAALGDDAAAKRAALAIVAKAGTGDIDAWLKDAYELLYRIDKKQGHTAAALDYYERYAKLDKAYLDDVSARAQAYQTVQQHVLAQKLETEQLTQQNAALRLQQALAAKSAEANRLYLVLLLLVLGFGAFWMYRLKRSQLRFKQLSHLDCLTAISNRQHFMGEAERVLLALTRERGAACMVFIDLDHFKLINDTHGHATGDEVLRHVVATCRQQLRPVDLFGRMGGEEFAILLVACSREQATAIAERIRQAVEASPVVVGDGAVGVSSSIGLAFTDACGHDLQRLCSEADAALYRAKRGGRNRVEAEAQRSACYGV